MKPTSIRGRVGGAAIALAMGCSQGAVTDAGAAKDAQVSNDFVVTEDLPPPADVPRLDVVTEDRVQPPDPPPPPVDVLTPSDAVDVPVDAPDVMACAAPTALCGGACVNTATNDAHCGACENACSSGTVCAAGTCGAPRIHALHPSIVDGASGTLVLEGAFGTSATVTFPGSAAPVPAMVLGPGRVQVSVPPDATAGALTVRTADATATSLVRFRRASFSLGLQPFRARYEQADYARQTPSLTTARVHAATLITGAWLYLLGGADASGAALGSIERAMINADGTLGAFQTPTTTLGSPREGAVAVRVRSAVYLLGGASRSPLRTIERATLNADGSLSGFSQIASQLVEARSGHVVEVIGSYVYVFGGGTTVIERAPIASDGSLGAFEQVQVNTLERRAYAGSQVIGSYVYLLGGSNGSEVSQTVERAVINPDGTLRPFALAGRLASTRAGASSIALGARVFVAGGTDGSTARNTIEYADINSDGTLRAFAPLPERQLSAARHGASSALVGNHWYMVGGAASDPVRSIDRAEVNVSTAFGTPRNNPPPGLAEPRLNPTAVAIGPYVYVFGGIGPAGRAEDRGTERARVLDDGALDRFTDYAPLRMDTRFRNGAQVAVIGSAVYMIGGNWDTYQRTVLRIPINDDASLGPASIIAAGADLSHGRAFVLDDRVCIFGGINASNNYPRQPSCAAFGVGGTLSAFSAQTAMLPQPRHYLTGAVLDDGVYLVAGSETSARDDALIRSVVRCVISGTRQECAMVTGGVAVPRNLSSAAIVANSLALVGGNNNQTGRHLTSAERLGVAPSSGLTNGAIVENFALLLGLYGHATLVIENRLWLLGGWVPDGSGDQASASNQLVELR